MLDYRQEAGMLSSRGGCRPLTPVLLLSVFIPSSVMVHGWMGRGEERQVSQSVLMPSLSLEASRTFRSQCLSDATITNTELSGRKK